MHSGAGKGRHLKTVSYTSRQELGKDATTEIPSCESKTMPLADKDLILFLFSFFFHGIKSKKEILHGFFGWLALGFGFF